MKLSRAWIKELESPFVDGPPSIEDAISNIEDASVKCLDGPVKREQVIRLLRNGLWLLYHVEQRDVIEARKSQTKFYLLGDSYRVCEAGDERTHQEWVIALGKANHLQDMILGHFDATGVYVYTDGNVKVHDLLFPRVMMQFREIAADNELDTELQVYNGHVLCGRLKELLWL